MGLSHRKHVFSIMCHVQISFGQEYITRVIFLDSLN